MHALIIRKEILNYVAHKNSTNLISSPDHHLTQKNGLVKPFKFLGLVKTFVTCVHVATFKIFYAIPPQKLLGSPSREAKFYCYGKMLRINDLQSHLSFPKFNLAHQTVSHCEVHVIWARDYNIEFIIRVFLCRPDLLLLDGKASLNF